MVPSFNGLGRHPSKMYMAVRICLELQKYSYLAHLVERQAVNLDVVGAEPAVGANIHSYFSGRKLDC